MADLNRPLKKLSDTLKRKIQLTVSRCIIRLINDAASVQQLQVTGLPGETLDNIDRFQQYGFTSYPLAGAEGIMVAVGGDRSHCVVIAVEDMRYRPKDGESGDSIQFDFEGQKVHLTRTGIVVKGKNIRFETEGVLRLEADGIEIAAKTYLQSEVNGYGQRRTNTDGVDYHDVNYVTGANPTSENVAIDQPDLPSDHPEGP